MFNLERSSDYLTANLLDKGVSKGLATGLPEAQNLRSQLGWSSHRI